jgi:hypothetical protein
MKFLLTTGAMEGEASRGNNLNFRHQIAPCCGMDFVLPLGKRGQDLSD